MSVTVAIIPAAMTSNQIHAGTWSADGAAVANRVMLGDAQFIQNRRWWSASNPR
jgi:hypothetical protein